MQAKVWEMCIERKKCVCVLPGEHTHWCWNKEELGEQFIVSVGFRDGDDG